MSDFKAKMRQIRFQTQLKCEPTKIALWDSAPPDPLTEMKGTYFNGMGRVQEEEGEQREGREAEGGEGKGGNGPKPTHPFKNADFHPIFVRIASAVTSSEKSSIKTNRESSFPMS